MTNVGRRRKMVPEYLRTYLNAGVISFYDSDTSNSVVLNYKERNMLFNVQVFILTSFYFATDSIGSNYFLYFRFVMIFFFLLDILIIYSRISITKGENVMRLMPFENLTFRDRFSNALTSGLYLTFFMIGLLGF